MNPTYAYHSDPPPPARGRYLYLFFDLAAVLLLVAGGHSLYLYFTHWTGGDDGGAVWQLILGLLYLIVGVLVAYFAHHQGRPEEPAPERYVTVSDGHLTYVLDSISGKQRLPLAGLTEVNRLSVRDLMLEFSDGRQVVLPIYLIDGEEKQVELERVLERATKAR